MSTAPESANPRLTVVVAATQPWPEVRACLDSLRDQVRDPGMEMLLAVADGSALPAGIAPNYPHVQVLNLPGASVFQLRAHAVRAARGDIVAITEDHCIVAPDWCARIVDAHRRHPEAAAIGGAVENGATERLIDWASFFLVNGASMPPVRSGRRRAISLQANISYKREHLPPNGSPLGQMEWMLNLDLRKHGAVLRTDHRLLVHHVQSLGNWGTCRIHYDDGRSIAAFRLQTIDRWEHAARVLACAVMPPALLARAVCAVAVKRRRFGVLIAGLPWMAVLVCFKTAGSLVGFLHGPGTSPQRIR